MSYSKTKKYGGDGGAPFEDNLTEVEQLIAVSIRHGSRVDSITGVWSTTDGSQEMGEHHGGEGGTQSIFVLDKGEIITRVTVRHGSEVDSLEFSTNKGKTVRSIFTSFLSNTDQ